MNAPSLRRLLGPARPALPETVASKEELARLAEQVLMTEGARQQFNELLHLLPLDSSVGLAVGLVFLKVLSDEKDQPTVVKSASEYVKDQVRILALEGAVPFIEELVPRLLKVLVSCASALMLAGIWVGRAIPLLLLLILAGLLICAICFGLRQRAKKQQGQPNPSPQEEQRLPDPSQPSTRPDGTDGTS